MRGVCEGRGPPPTYRADGDVPRAYAELIMYPSHCLHHIIVVSERLTHAHEHHVGETLGLVWCRVIWCREW